MITIPTSELIGLISDVLAFAPSDKDASHHGVLIEWDGERLAAAAHSVLSGGESRWVPGDGEEAEFEAKGSNPDPSLGVHWGDDGTTSRFRVFVHMADAKEIVKVFKLPAKFRMTPVNIDINAMGTRLFIERNAERWCTAHAMRIDVAEFSAAASFPHIKDVVAGAFASDGPGSIVLDGPLEFSASRLAAFGAVRAYNVMSLTYRGPDAMAPVQIGTGFSGFIFPARVNTSAAATMVKAASGAGKLDLRHGSGLHVSIPVESAYEDASS